MTIGFSKLEVIKDLVKSSFRGMVGGKDWRGFQRETRKLLSIEHPFSKLYCKEEQEIEQVEA